MEELPNIWTSQGIWVVYLGFAIKATYYILGLWLFFRVMKFLKLRIQVLERDLQD
ncbi:MAG: hypothetical protein KJN59_03730 [Bacteroidia bacterium]|nr:hypothetical protein [Bacteroidia bacterium]